MCGIFGMVSWGEKPVNPQCLEAMGKTLIHRGPDDRFSVVRGRVGLGATRLSLIDLSGGRQPLSNEDQTVWACQNGEIYSYQTLTRDLQHKGHRFETASDTEVLVHLYEEEGEEFAKSLSGMFAIAVWDQAQERLILARDRMGVKPLYYVQHDGVWYFASEIKALLAAGVPKKIDPVAVSDYLSCDYVPGPRTIFEKIWKLPAGYRLVVEHGGIRTENNHPFQVPVERSESEEELKKSLRDVLSQAVKETLISDVPVGAFLSGGVDSSAVVALASQYTNRLSTFSVGFHDQSYNELGFARLVAKKFGTDHHEIFVDLSDPDRILKIMQHFDEPFGDSSALATFAVSEFAAKSVKAVLSGDGGDELFGGYKIYHADQLLRFYRRLPKVLKSKILPAMVRKIPVSHRKTSWEFQVKRFVRGGVSDPVTAHFLWRAIFTEKQKRDLLLFSDDLPVTARIWRDVARERKSSDLLNTLMELDMAINLSDDMLTRVDRMSMANHLEVRVPFLEASVVDFARSLPSHWKWRRGTLKYLLKAAMADLLPLQILYRPKAGFHVPMARWLTQEFRPLVETYLSQEMLNRQHVFYPQKVRELVDQHQRRSADWSREIWGLLAFAIWYETWMK